MNDSSKNYESEVYSSALSTEQIPKIVIQITRFSPISATKTDSLLRQMNETNSRKINRKKTTQNKLKYALSHQQLFLTAI